MQALARAHSSKTHWACDSFAGLPAPSPSDGRATADSELCAALVGRQRSGYGAKRTWVNATACGSARRARQGAYRSSRADFEANLARFGMDAAPAHLRVVQGLSLIHI